MIATLPMYDRPETAATNDALWTAIGRHLSDAPASLNRTATLEDAWTDPALVLSQTCGLPFSTWVKDHARYVASPDFRLPNTPAGYYHSVIIARAEDPRNARSLLKARPAVNDVHSQSGYAALFAFAEAEDVPLAPVYVTGGHALSAKAVESDHADIAAIDANTWRLIMRWDNWSKRLRVIARTPPTPAMPFICGLAQNPATLRDALESGIASLSDTQKDTIGLYGIKTLPIDAYFAVPRPPSAQIRHTT